MSTRTLAILSLVLGLCLSPLASADSKLTYTRKNGDEVTISKYKSQYGKTIERRIQSANGHVKSSVESPGFQSTYTQWTLGDAIVSAKSKTINGKRSWQREVRVSRRPYHRVISDRYPGGKTGPMEIKIHWPDDAPILSIVQLHAIATKLDRPIVSKLNDIEVMVTKDQTMKEAAAPYLQTYPNAIEHLAPQDRAKFAE